MPTFVDFYRAHHISPVRQDISDLERHFSRRESLYRSLGIPAAFVRGRDVIEFGPGSGYNAIFTASLHPRRYVLVDGNPTGLSEAEALLRGDVAPSTPEFRFVLSLIEDYRDEECYDLVLCEGTIPFQADPSALARAVGARARPGGILVVTTIDSVSFLAEFLRRLLARRIVDLRGPIEEVLAVLRPVFATHLASLPQASRPLDDWLLDNVVQQLPPPGFSLPEAIATLSPTYEIYATSPRFIVDWRWYKALHGDERRFNERAVEAYFASALNLIDQRIVVPATDPAFGTFLAARSDEIVAQIAAAADEPAQLDVDALQTRLRSLSQHIAPHAAEASAALNAFARYLVDDDLEMLQTSAFPAFFGRGQQYASFIRVRP